MKLAIYNFGLFVASYDSSEVEGFRLREPVNFLAAETAQGFIGRSGYDGDPGPESWGQQVFPRFIEGSGFETAPSSLSLWADLESLMAFSYSGVHADALKHAKNWQVEKQWLLWFCGGPRGVPIGPRPSSGSNIYMTTGQGRGLFISKIPTGRTASEYPSTVPACANWPRSILKAMGICSPMCFR